MTKERMLTIEDIQKKCSVSGCKQKHKGHGYCQRHLMQIKKYGEIKGAPSVSRRSPNQFIIVGDSCSIVIRNIWGEVIGAALIDADDYERCKDIKWAMHNNGYVRANIWRKYLHRWIAGQDGMEIDHINGNKLDNRKANLRTCSSLQNNMNSRLRKDNKSGYKGVYWNKQRQKWHATVKAQGKRQHLGFYENKSEAATAYNHAAINFFGEFACLNEL